MSSDEYSTDEVSKKRRAVKDIELAFERSKKTVRSPEKQGTNDDKLDQILKMMSELKKEQKEIIEEVKQVRKEQQQYKEEIRSLKQENENLKEDNVKIKKENQEIKKELQEISNMMEKIEQQRRKNNVVITGLTLQSNDSVLLKETINNFLKTELKIDVTAKHVTKVGGKTSVVVMQSEEEKRMVMQNKAKLRECKLGRIYINDDLTRREQLKQKHIRLAAEEHRKQGKTVKIGYNKLIINENEWRWNRITEKLEETQPKN